MTVISYSPRTGLGEPAVDETSIDAVDAAVAASDAAFPVWSQTSRDHRATILQAVADALDAKAPELAAIADEETALGIDPRLRGEVKRTSDQLRMFASQIRAGDYLEPVITSADAEKGIPDLRRINQPLGPVAVFSASNFPFAFSVAGGDTASALAAGCPVVVKAHPAHPRTSVATAQVVTDALRSAGAPEDLLHVVHGHEAGVALVQAEGINAVGFTGSLAGGRALAEIAAGRPRPIPFYGELGSINPVVVLPDAARARAEEIARGYLDSVTLGAGQFCTNPGVLLVPSDAPGLTDQLASKIGDLQPGPMLTAGIRNAYLASQDELHDSGADAIGTSKTADSGWSVPARLWRVSGERFLSEPDRFAHEIFGPNGVIVTYNSVDEARAVLHRLPGSLTATVHGTDADEPIAAELLPDLQAAAGRLIYNGWPTGVAVVPAQHHGGPWPSSTTPAHTSVGTAAIYRWLTPVAYQNWPDALLPPELQRANPLGVNRNSG